MKFKRRPFGGNVSAYRCIGVSAFAKRHQLRRDLLVTTGVSKSSLLPQTPIRGPADTLPQPATRFERNDVTIICETVHECTNLKMDIILGLGAPTRKNHPL